MSQIIQEGVGNTIYMNYFSFVTTITELVFIYVNGRGKVNFDEKRREVIDESRGENSLYMF